MGIDIAAHTPEADEAPPNRNATPYLIFLATDDPFPYTLETNMDLYMPHPHRIIRKEFIMDGNRLLTDTGGRDILPPEPLPHHIRIFFWDVDSHRLSIVKSAQFIIGRLMEHGDESAVRFLLENYNHDDLVRALGKSRSISRRSRVFWTLFLGIDEKSCIPKQYPTPYGACSNALMDSRT